MAVGSKWRGVVKYTIGGVAMTALFACGHSHPTAPLVATSDLTVDIGAANIAALLPAAGASPTTFTFSNGFSGTGPSGAAFNVPSGTTVEIDGTASAPTFQFTGNGTASGTLTFGSCDFKVTSATGGFAGLLTLGTLKVTPCSLTANTSGHLSGSTSTVTVVLTLGNNSSVAIPLLIQINSDGTVSINGHNVGTVTVGASTGGT